MRTIRSIKAVAKYVDGSELFTGYLTDEQNALIIHEGWVWLVRVKKSNKAFYDVIPPLTMLGYTDKSPDDKEYAEKLIDRLKNMSLYEYITQYYYHIRNEFNFEITELDK
ncbi:hypothetical protein [Bacillus litorisediminis]|uniref:hypothetical protein n=1 Tax=Bacillus litorisediminis TaxID=2922713 RepID=UPI001FAF94ED|nr:hypothetical protein [Bacillus litorisediminis]